MQWGWLRTFVAVYREGSFTKAARRLNLSQPAVTQQIRGLEKKLGRPLFERVPEGARPTAAAEALLRDLEGPVDALSAAVSRHLGASCPAKEPPLYLGGPNELVTSRVLPAVSGLVRDGLELHCGFGLADELLEGLVEGRFDLVLSTVRPRSRAIEETPLFDEEFVLVASRELAAELTPERVAADGPAVLRKYPLISYASSMPIIRRYWRTVFEVHPEEPPQVVVPDLRGALAAVRASAGISVLPTYLCADELARGEVVPLLDPEIPPINTIYVANRAGESAHSRTAMLRRLLLLKAQVWMA